MSSVQFKVATGTVARASDVIPTNDPDLIMSLGVGVYALWGNVVFDSGDTNTAQFAFATSVPADNISIMTPMITDNDLGIQAANSIAVPITNVIPTYDFGDISPGDITSISFTGMVAVSSGAFDLALRWAQGVSKVLPVNRGKNSWFAVARLA